MRWLRGRWEAVAPSTWDSTRDYEGGEGGGAVPSTLEADSYRFSHKNPPTEVNMYTANQVEARGDWKDMWLPR